MSISRVLVTALWTGSVFGILEGIVLHLVRMYPAILAPYKGSVHMLWLTPVVECVVFSAIGLTLVLLWRLLRTSGISWLQRAPSDAQLFGLFSFVGLWLVLSAPKLLHPAASVLLAAGVGQFIHDRAKPYDGLTFRLRRHAAVLAPLLLVLCAGSYGYEYLRETTLARALPAAGRNSNVLVLVLDTVRYDHFQRLIGEGRLPALRKISEEGTTFTNAWSTTSWSLPSQASILTGQGPDDHRADWPGLTMSPGSTTLPEFLSRKGYVTGAFSGNANWITPEYLGRGFLRFRVYRWEDLLRRTGSGRRIGRVAWEFGFHEAGRGRPAAELNRDFFDFIDSYPSRPFFAYVCYMDVNRRYHEEMLNHPFWSAKVPVSKAVDAYDRALSDLDRDVDVLLEGLRARRLLNDTLVLITSDHGESFGSTFSGDHDPSGHGTSLYSEQTRVPLIGWYSQWKPGTVSTDAVSIDAIPATVAKLLGWSDAPFRGPDLVNPSPKGSLLATLRYGDANLRSAVYRSWQHIRDLNKPGDPGLMFDLSRDPAGRMNLIGKVSIPVPIASRIQ